MKKEMRKNKNNIFSPKNILIGFFVIIVLLLIFNYTYTFSKKDLDLSKDELGEFYQSRGKDICSTCDKECQECLDKPGSEDGKYCQNKNERGYCDANYGSGEWENGWCIKGHCTDSYDNNCGSYNCNECSTCVTKDGIPVGWETESKNKDPCSNGKGTCEDGECKIPECKIADDCENPQCQKCENGECAADDFKPSGRRKGCGINWWRGACYDGKCCYAIGGCYPR